MKRVMRKAKGTLWPVLVFEVHQRRPLMTNLSALHVDYDYDTVLVPVFVFRAAGVALCSWHYLSRVLRLTSAFSDSRNLQTAKPARTIPR